MELVLVPFIISGPDAHVEKQGFLTAIPLEI
jgi:hypothetical protein